LWLCVVILSNTLAACAPVYIPTSDTPPASPHAATSATKPGVVSPAAPTPTEVLPEGGSIVIGVVGDLNLEVNAMPAFLQNAIFDTLLQIDPQSGSLKPALAESFQVSSDATTITFRLRPNVRWHDGARFTAEDVVATMRAFAAPGFRGTPVTDFGANARADALDDLTVQVTFSEGYCPALTSIGAMNILPRAVVASANFPRLTPAQMIGTGALKFQSRNGDQILLARNEEYYRGKPPIESWTLRVFPDAAALRAAFQAKQIDVMPASAREYAAIQKLGEAVVASSAAPEVVTLLFNAETPTLNDPRVRQALNYALDRSALLAERDIAGQGQLVDALVLPAFWANTTNPPRYPYDVAKAKQILADAGWRDAGDGVLRKNNRPMRLELWSEADDPLLEPLAFRIRELYAALGIEIVLQLDDRAGWVTRAFQHRFDMLLLSRRIPLDPDQRWYWQSDQNEKGNGFNFGSYANARVDAALKESLRVPACDANARAALFGEINRTLVTEAPAAFLFAPQKYLVARERVVGLAPSAFAGDYANIIQWYVK
jgi:peptide/nickel transport system substrate-binding protein